MVKAALAIAADIRERIARGELSAGDPLPVESDLTDRLGVSKGVVREALRILETEGLIEVRRGIGGGPKVRHPSIQSTAMTMGIYLQLGDVLVLDVMEARDRIIALAVERLALRRGSPDAGVLDAAVTHLGTLVGDFDAYYPQLIEVGETAVRLAGNRTEFVLVVALRHIIAAELEAATRAINDRESAVSVEADIARAWAQIARGIHAGRAEAARRAFEAQAQVVRDGLEVLMPARTVVDVFSGLD